MKIKAAIAVLFVLIVLAVLWGMLHDRRLDEAFSTIVKQTSEAQVLAAMGAPNAIQRPCRAYDTELAANCDHVFIYRSSFAPLRHKYWLVFLDENNEATATSSEKEP
jgi:hypothetical protein